MTSSSAFNDAPRRARRLDFDSERSGAASEEFGSTRRVSFRNIEVFEHEYIMGDNPSVSGGAPLTISWQQQNSEEFHVDDYETTKLQHRRKQKNELRLSVSDRAQLLLQSGYTMEDIVQRSLQVNEDKDLRAESLRNKKWDGLKYGFERTTSKMKKVVKKTTKFATTPFQLSQFSRSGSSKQNLAASTGALHSSPSSSIKRTIPRRNSSFGPGDVGKTSPTSVVPKLMLRRNSALNTTTTSCSGGGDFLSASERGPSRPVSARMLNTGISFDPYEHASRRPASARHLLKSGSDHEPVPKSRSACSA